MFDLVPILSTILPIIASTLLIAVIFFNIYLKIRRNFPKSVNCWFCNSWTKVPYDDRNSFDCPTCLQYNGFTKDGAYNKIIPEQHDELMNKSAQISSQKLSVSNGLCVLCNNNLQLKIFQLAHFVPLVEENYDVEIEHFQTQLEKAYKLCKKCDRVLKKTLETQNAWLFGNHIKNICNNGISRVADQIRKKTGLSLLAKIDGLLSLLLAISIALVTISSIKFPIKYIPSSLIPFHKQFVDVMSISRVVEVGYRTVKFEPYLIICSSALVYQLGKILCGQNITATKVNQFLCWVILFLLSWVQMNKNFLTYIHLLEAFCCIYLISTAFCKPEDKKQPLTTGKSMRKLVRNLENTCSDLSDVSDFENVSSSTKPSCCKSTYSTLDVPQPTNTAGNCNLLNSSFTSARSTFSLDLNNRKNAGNLCDVDLNKSLDNLRLGRLNYKPPKFTCLAVSRPKPVLSPPKFNNGNSWVAGGFWRDAGLGVNLTQRTNLSRSSSESSGFGSQHNENLQFDKLSEFSTWSAVPTFPFSSPDLRRINTVYPSLQPNDMLVLPRVGSPGLIRFNESYQTSGYNWSDKINTQAMQSFRDLNLHSK